MIIEPVEKKENKIVDVGDVLSLDEDSYYIVLCLLTPEQHFKYGLVSLNSGGAYFLDGKKTLADSLEELASLTKDFTKVTGDYKVHI